MITIVCPTCLGRKSITCPECNGVGTCCDWCEGDESVPCGDCNGHGTIEVPDFQVDLDEPEISDEASEPEDC